MAAIMSGVYANKAVAGNQALSCTSPAGAWHICRCRRSHGAMSPAVAPAKPFDRLGSPAC